jgi:hypothetical protein
MFALHQPIQVRIEVFAQKLKMECQVFEVELPAYDVDL